MFVAVAVDNGCDTADVTVAIDDGNVGCNDGDDAAADDDDVGAIPVVGTFVIKCGRIDVGVVLNSLLLLL